jgi:hypothetical protein
MGPYSPKSAPERDRMPRFLATLNEFFPLRSFLFITDLSLGRDETFLHERPGHVWSRFADASIQSTRSQEI